MFLPEQTPIGALNPELYQNEGGVDDDWETVGMGAGSLHVGRLWFTVEVLTEEEEVKVEKM